MSPGASAIKDENSAYRLSFISCGLMPQYAQAYISLYSETHDWKKARQIGQQRNIVQGRTLNSIRRLGNELVMRLRHLHDEELVLFNRGDVSEKNYLLWLAVCRCYRFIGDFMRLHLATKLANGDPHISRDDFNIFFTQQVDTHPELASLASSSRVRMGFSFMRLMRDAGIINAEGVIRPVSSGPECLTWLGELPREERLYFPALAY